MVSPICPCKHHIFQMLKLRCLMANMFKHQQRWCFTVVFIQAKKWCTMLKGGACRYAYDKCRVKAMHVACKSRPPL